MAISFAFVTAMVVKALMVVCLSKETIQADRPWRHDKQPFRKSIVNSPDERQVSSGNVLPINVKEKRQAKRQDISHFENAESAISTSQRQTASHRSKRVIFHVDDRRVVPRKYIERCPYTAAVMISTGCSGVLVSPRHVLTSAHCLHNGSHYVDGYRNLRVGFLLKNRTTVWHAVSSTKMPKQWKSGMDRSATVYDYALIKLSKNHSRCFLPIAPSKAFFFKTACAHKAIYFTAFDEDRGESTMLFRGCRVENLSTNLLYHCCDAQRGSSGAGVYEVHRNNGSRKSQRYVVGVFSGNRDKFFRRPPTNCEGRVSFYRNFHDYPFYRVNYNAALRLKENDVYYLCTWMKKLGGENCKKFLKERRRRRRQSRKRREKHKDERCQGKF